MINLRIRAQIGITLVVSLGVVNGLLILFMGSGSVFNGPAITTTEPTITTTTTQKTSPTERFAYIDLTRVGAEPDDYMELTACKLSNTRSLWRTTSFNFPQELFMNSLLLLRGEFPR